jgi:hypothetical protein
VLGDSFSGVRGEKVAKSHAFVQDLALWVSVLDGRPEASVLQCAAREYQFALLSVVTGHYRSAFSALRLALELGLACVQWSANERELREWRVGKRDSNWNAVADQDNGVLSKQFVRLFTDGLADEAPHYRGAAVAVYRECSEYVHGNAHTHHCIPANLAFDESSFDAWMSKGSVVRLVTTFALAARYLEDLDSAVRQRLEGTLLDHLGHSVAIRVLVGAPTESTNG